MVQVHAMSPPSGNRMKAFRRAGLPPPQLPSLTVGSPLNHVVSYRMSSTDRATMPFVVEQKLGHVAAWIAVSGILLSNYCVG